jgi:hypothetical protein
MDAVAAGEGAETLRISLVDADTLFRIARVEWEAADVTTGRGVTTSRKTVAERAGVSLSTVDRARRLLVALGFEVTIVPGRYLYRTERSQAREAHGGYQSRAASVRALTIPRPTEPVDNDDLPSRREGRSVPPVLNSSPKRASARKMAISSMKTRSSSITRRHRDGKPRPFKDQQLVGHLVPRLPWLTAGRHIGFVHGYLARIGVSGAEWTANGLLAALNLFCIDEGIHMVDPHKHRDPFAYLGWLVKSARAAGVVPDRVRWEHQQALAAAERERRAEETRLEAERVAAIDWDAVEAIKAKMRREFPASPKTRRRMPYLPALQASSS